MKKNYYLTFKTKQHEKIHTSVECEKCHGKYTYYNKSRHLKTKRHLNVLNEKEKKQEDIIYNMKYFMCEECLKKREEVFGIEEMSKDERNISIWCIHKYEEEKERIKNEKKGKPKPKPKITKK